MGKHIATPSLDTMLAERRATFLTTTGTGKRVAAQPTGFAPLPAASHTSGYKAARAALDTLPQSRPIIGAL